MFKKKQVVRYHSFQNYHRWRLYIAWGIVSLDHLVSTPFVLYHCWKLPENKNFSLTYGKSRSKLPLSSSISSKNKNKDFLRDGRKRWKKKEKKRNNKRHRSTQDIQMCVQSLLFVCSLWCSWSEVHWTHLSRFIGLI